VRAVIHQEILALGDRRFRAERGWGELPPSKGRVTDVAVDPRGHVFALFRYDAMVAAPGPAVMELSPDGRLLAQWGEGLLLDAHMLTRQSPDPRPATFRASTFLSACRYEVETE
jgi:hypothetical protein